jgi:hypothetical protein
VKLAKSEAKKGNHLLSHSLAKEVKAAGSPEEKRELLNSTLNKLRQLGENRYFSDFNRDNGIFGITNLLHNEHNDPQHPQHPQHRKIFPSETNF